MSIACKFWTHERFGWCSIYCDFLTKINPAKFSVEPPYRDIFSFEFVAYQPLQCRQIACANKQEIQKMERLL